MSRDPAPRLELANDHLAALRAAAMRAYPDEFCALLVGITDNGRAGEAVLRVTRVVFAANLDPEPRHGFELDPRVLIDVLRELRQAERAGRGDDERVLGHAHSHPDAEAYPSSRDEGSAHELGQVWFIVPVREGSAGAPRAFQAMTGEGGGTAFREIAIVVASRPGVEGGDGLASGAETP